MPEIHPLILIVDDTPDFVEVISVKLKTRGFRIESAVEGGEGLKKAKELKPDLIILDVHMPNGMDGMEALFRLKKDPETQKIPVVLFTNLGDPRSEEFKSARELALKNGAREYFQKDMELDEFANKIEAILKS